jgi:hypothetical protein
MVIFGIDFTSAPGLSKPITCARCELTIIPQPRLLLQDCLTFTSFHEFERFLAHGGPWLAALDFPFGQPLQLLTRLGWPTAWEDYVALIASMGKNAFEDTIASYRMSRPPGDKLHLRVTDTLAGARSPMMLHRIPVGKMFFAGASRLLHSGVSILPCRPTDANRIVVEGYPALVARRWSEMRSYKSDERKKQTMEQMATRQRIIDGIRSLELVATYGVSLLMSDDLADILLQDAMGDQLDAVLCAIQAAWAFLRRDQKYGIPPEHEAEGWIVDPLLI